MGLSVAPGTEGVEEEDGGGRQPVDDGDGAPKAAAALPGTGVVPVLQELFHGGGLGAGVGEEGRADACENDGQAHAQDVGGGRAPEDGGEEGQGGQDAEHGGDGIQAVEPVLPRPAALLDHAADAVLRLKGLGLQEGEVPGAPAAGEEEGHADGHEDEENAEAQARGGVLRQGEAGGFAEVGKGDEGHGAQHAEEGGQRHPRGRRPAERQVRGGLLHADPPQGGLVGRHVRLRRLQLVLQQEIRADAEKAAHLQDLLHVRHGLGALPLGDGLPGDAQLLRQLLLGPAGLLAKLHDLFCQNHGILSYSAPGRETLRRCFLALW